METGNEDLSTKGLAITGTILIWLPIVLPLLFSGFFLVERGLFRFDYLMPAEFFFFALAGGILLIWAAVRAKSKQLMIGWSISFAVFTLISMQGLAVASGLASGRTEPHGFWLIIVMMLLIMYILSLILCGIAAILLLRDLFKPSQTDKVSEPDESPTLTEVEMDMDTLKQTIKSLDSRCASSPLEIFSPRPEDDKLFEALCALYVSGDTSKRQQIKHVLQKREGVHNCLVGFAYQCAQKLKDSSDEKWLHLGVAAAEMAKQSMDYRDLLLVLAELYVVAEECGLDPNPPFQEIAGEADFSTAAVVKSRRSGTGAVAK
jgi:hypothetical protein